MMMRMMMMMTMTMTMTMTTTTMMTTTTIKCEFKLFHSSRMIHHSMNGINLTTNKISPAGAIPLEPTNHRSELNLVRANIMRPYNSGPCAFWGFLQTRDQVLEAQVQVQIQVLKALVQVPSNPCLVSCLL